MKLTDITLCSCPDAFKCKHFIYLAYKAQGAVVTFPHSDSCPCDHCKWMVRDGDFYEEESLTYEPQKS